jgi:multiple sugar transport system substrate-binding protein
MAEIRDITDYVAKDALSRRRFLQTTGLLAASLAAGPLLEACGGGGTSGSTGTGSSTYVPPKAKAGAKVQLLQWNSFVAAADAEFKRQAAQFSSENGCTVTIQTVSGDDLIAKTPVAVEAGSGPDIIQMEYGWPHLYETSCVDVSADVAYLKGKLGAVHPVNDAFCKVNGKYRAIPYTQVPNAWSYRTDMWQTAGLSKFPTTWEELAAAGKTLTDKKLGQIAVSLGHAYGDAITMWYPVLWDFGGREATPDGKTVTINSAETLAAVNWAINAWKSNSIAQNTLSWLDPDNNQAYHSGLISATLNGASIYLKEKLINHKYDQVTDNAAQPGGPKGISTLNLIFNHAVMTWSPEQETARAFLLWAMDPPQYSKWMGVASGYDAGPYATFTNDPVWSTDPKLKPFHDVVPNGKWPGWPATPGKATANSQVQFTIVDMFAKAVTSGDAKGSIADAESKLKRIYGKPA